MPVGVIKRIKAPPEAFLAVCDVLGVERHLGCVGGLGVTTFQVRTVWQGW